MKRITCSRRSRNLSPFVARTRFITTTPFGPGASYRMARSPMRNPDLRPAALALLVAACTLQPQAQERYGTGRAATSADIAAWNIDVGGNDGSSLRAWSGTVEH